MVNDLFQRLPRALENVDDSDGGGSEIAGRAADLHLAACEAARPGPVSLARELFRLETSEDFGTFAGASERYAPLLGSAGQDEYRRLAQAAWDRLPQTRQRRGGTVTPQEDGFARYQLFPILDRFAEQAGDVDRRIALREAQLELRTTTSAWLSSACSRGAGRRRSAAPRRGPGCSTACPANRCCSSSPSGTAPRGRVQRPKRCSGRASSGVPRCVSTRRW
jgi:hypothetical protein